MRVDGVLELFRPVRDLVWPASCAACGVPGRTLCPACALDVATGGRLRAHRPSPPPPGFPATLTWASYEGALRRLVVAHKDEDRADAIPVLAAILEKVVETAVDGLTAPVLVPVPSSAASRRTRGREPLLDLARAVRLTSPLRLVSALRVVRRVRDQAGLGQDQRRANLSGSMAVTAGAGRFLDGADVVLLDDVVTTGATLAEAARALAGESDAGTSWRVASVRAAVICATQRRM